MEGLGFGKRLKELRQEKNLTQVDLGKILLLNKSSISRYELTNQLPEIDTLQRMAKYFNVSLEYLLGETDFRNRDEEALKIIEAFEKEGISKNSIDLKLLDKVIKMYKLAIE